MLKKWYDGTVLKIEHHNATTRSFFIEVNDDEILDFKAGQFVTFDLPIAEQRNLRWRSYSIANHFDQSNILEFCIVSLAKGRGTDYLFDEIKVGSIIKFKKPSGVFTLKKDETRDLVFISTGTGLAPFRSILRDLYWNKKEHGKVHLIFGTKHKEGILYQKEFEELTKKMKHFNYSVALSQEENLPKENFQIKKGHIHQFYLDDYKEVRENIVFYICGWQNMVDEAVKNITSLGYDKNQIRFELYG